MNGNHENRADAFASSFVSDIKNRTLKKDSMKNTFVEFTGGMEDLYRQRFNRYISSCGCFLTDLWLRKNEDWYHG